MVARWLLLEAGALGGVMVDVLAAAPRRRRAAIAAHRIAPHSQAWVMQGALEADRFTWRALFMKRFFVMDRKDGGKELFSVLRDFVISPSLKSGSCVTFRFCDVVRDCVLFVTSFPAVYELTWLSH